MSASPRIGSLPAKSMRRRADPAREVCIVVLTRHGRRSRRAISAGATIGERDSVFEDAAPYAVYLPPRRDARIVRAHRDARDRRRAARRRRAASPARLIEPASMKRSTRGEGANTRYVCDILPQTEPAERLLVVEVRHAGRAFVELSAAQARHRQRARRKLARGDLLSPAESAAGLRVPARLYRRRAISTRRWRSRITTS